jgi:hypothetical protein
MSYKHPGSAENMRPGGPDESSGKRQNSPFRALHEGGHGLNHSYKNPVASLLGETGAVNHSYLHPLDHGAGPAPEVPKGAWAKANEIKPISQQGRAGRTGGTVIV